MRGIVASIAEKSDWVSGDILRVIGDGTKITGPLRSYSPQRPRPFSSQIPGSQTPLFWGGRLMQPAFDRFTGEPIEG